MSYETSVNLFVFSMVLPATLFPILYGIFAPWWRSHIGRALMAHAVGMLLLIDISAATIVFGENYPGRHVVGFIILTLLALGLWYQVVALVLVRLRAREGLE